jgi:hypothetical protein
MNDAHRRPKRAVPASSRSSREGKSAEAREARVERAERLHPNSVEAVAIAEAKELLAQQRESLPGWTKGSEKHPVWRKKGVAYTVIAKHEKLVWGVSDPPYRVLSPEGVLLGGSSHLKKAQKVCEVLEVPLARTPLFAAAVGPVDETIATPPPSPREKRLARDTARIAAGGPVRLAAVPAPASFVDLGDAVSSASPSLSRTPPAEAPRRLRKV